MYIKKYWGNFIGGSDDSLNLVAFLEDQKKEEIPLSEIFAKIADDAVSNFVRIQMEMRFLFVMCHIIKLNIQKT